MTRKCFWAEKITPSPEPDQGRQKFPSRSQDREKGGFFLLKNTSWLFTLRKEFLILSKRDLFF